MRALGSARVVAALLLLFRATPAHPDSLETLIMPGPLSEAHEEVEPRCAECHAPFQKASQRSFCLVCHEDISLDIASGKGHHGRTTARTVECSTCHADHLGRDADIVGLDPETFDHALTDFPLRGRHESSDCRGCHPADSRHRDAASSCAECHGRKDPHRGSFGDACADCHSEEGWDAARFDHDKTGWALVGSHSRTACDSCHPNARYERTPRECYACHSVNDAHAGRFGRKCETCHTSVAWKRPHFDHAVDTKFPLLGSHGALRCQSCHESDPRDVRLASDCYACHRADDEHKGRFRTECATCHDSTTWRECTFDHDRSTEFPLRGRHRDVDCTSCHVVVIGAAPLNRTCGSCHVDDDAHKGQQGEDCARCHRESGWARDVFFDHDLTRFPLLGLHAVASCEECHASAAFRDTASACASCHDRDDFHERRLGRGCELCHNPNGWNFWRFDHDTQTAFRLDGAHAEARCHDCHASAVDEIRVSSTCGTCHADDDVHLGRFGQSCSRCHTTSTWKGARPTRDSARARPSGS